MKKILPLKEKGISPATIFNLFLFTVIITSCSEKRTSDAREAYMYWTDGYTSKEVEVLKGEYWQSAHWSKEYVVFLKLKVTENWWMKYKEANNFKRIDEIDVLKSDLLQIDNPDWIKRPDWFTPTEGGEVYELFGGSKYFWNAKNKTLFIYEIQL